MVTSYSLHNYSKYPADPETFDKYYSGKFLITKARHEFSSLGKRYKIYLSAVKDAFNSQLPNGGAEAQQPISRR